MRVALCGPMAMEALRKRLPSHVQSRLPSGLGGTPVAHLASALLDAGHEVLIATLDRDVDEPVEVRGPNLVVRIGQYRRSKRARDAFSVERRAIADALAREPIDVIHAHWTYEFALGALAIGQPTIVTVHDWAPTILRLNPGPYRAMRLLMNAVTLARGQHYTVPSPYLRARLERWTNREIVVIPNALVDESFTGPRPYPLGPPRFLSVNDGFGARKNTATLMRAFAELRVDVPQARLLLVGRQHGVNERAHQWAMAEGLTEGVTFLGSKPHSDILALMRAAHVLVHPSREESFGLVVAEAMSQGTPVVAGRNSGAIPWLLDYGNVGVLTDVLDPSSMALSMRDVLANPGSWEDLSMRGFEHSMSEFSARAVFDRYMNEYRRVMESL